MPLPVGNEAWASPQARAADGPEPPEPGFFETVGASFRATRADTSGYANEAQVDAYQPVINTLEGLGYNFSAFVNPRSGTVSPEAVWRAVERERGRGHFKSLPATMDQFEEQWRSRKAQSIAMDEATAARGGVVARFTGGMAGAMTDPINIMTLPFGGAGRTVTTRIAGEVLANAGIEALLQPTAQAQREALGRDDLTLGEAAANVAFAGLGAGVLRGGFEAAPKIRAAIEPRLPSLPPALRERWERRSAPGATPKDDPALMADMAEALIGEDSLSELQRDAIEVVRADARADAAMPFRQDGGGVALHDALLGDAMARLMSDVPLAVRGPAFEAAPASAVRTSRASLARSTAIASRTIAGGGSGGFDRGMVKAAIRGPESGGRDDAVNGMGSSASGRYQFIESTFKSYFRKVFGGDADAAWRTKRFDPNVQERLMDALLDDNAAVLRRAGHAATTGNLYLAHFAGAGKAAELLGAPKDAPVSRYFSQKAIQQNPGYLGGGKTVGEAIAAVEAAVGGRAAGSTREGSASVREDFGEEDFRAQLQDEIDALTGDIARLAGERDAMEPAGIGDLPAPSPARTAEAGDGTDVLDALRRAVDARDLSLNKPGDLARGTGLSEPQVAEALERLAGLGEITVSRRGLYARKPRGGYTGSTRDDAVAFVARMGGVSYDGLGQGATAGAKGHDLRNTGALDHFVPGVGPLLRPKGRSLDEIGEALFDAGYFGPVDVTPRPDENAVIALLDRSIGKGERVYTDRAAMTGEDTAVKVFEDADADAQRWMIVEHNLQEAASLAGFRGIGNEQAIGIEALVRQGTDTLPPIAPEDASLPELVPYVLEFINREVDDVLDAAFLEAEDDFYEAIARSFKPAGEAAQAGAGGAGRAPDAGNARAGPTAGGTGAASDTGPRLAELPEAERSAASNPDSDILKAQADSLDHDARAALDRGDEADPATGERQRQEMALRAQAPLRGENRTGQAQDGAGNMGNGLRNLFDAADQTEFLLDPETAAKRAPDLLDEIDDEAAHLKSIRDCL